MFLKTFGPSLQVQELEDSQNDQSSSLREELTQLRAENEGLKEEHAKLQSEYEQLQEAADVEAEVSQLANQNATRSVFIL